MRLLIQNIRNTEELAKNLFLVSSQSTFAVLLNNEQHKILVFHLLLDLWFLKKNRLLVFNLPLQTVVKISFTENLSVTSNPSHTNDKLVNLPFSCGGTWSILCVLCEAYIRQSRFSEASVMALQIFVFLSCSNDKHLPYQTSETLVRDFGAIV